MLKVQLSQSIPMPIQIHLECQPGELHALVGPSGSGKTTVLRTIGVPLAHALISMKSTLVGLEKLLLNEEAFENDLEKNWAVVAEAIQTILRREGFPKPYEALKGLTRKNEAF